MSSGLWYPLADILAAAGVRVAVIDQNRGWESRSRSSGGFPAPPLGVWWHHTASSTTPASDLAWMCHNCPDRPVGNLLLARDGVVYPVAAGASNCAGKGGPATFSRGTVPQDQGNTRGFQIEAANSGVGEPWPVAQIDAYFATSNALNAYVGNRPDDVITHNVWAPTRKIDPATAAAVQGRWVPRACTGSGTWDLADIRAECLTRAGTPGPTPPGGDDMVPAVIKGDGSDTYWAWDGVQVRGIPSLEWVQWGYERGLYQNTDPVVYPQGFVDELVGTQGG